MEEEQMDFMNELLGVDPKDVEESVADESTEPGELSEPGKAEPDPVEALEEEKEEEDDEPEEDVTAILREQIQQLTSQLNQDPLRQTVAPVVPSADAAPTKKETLQNFLSEEELDRIIDEPQLLNQAFNRAIAVMEQNIQGVIQSEVNRQVLVSKAVSDFYTTNQDLIPYGGFVQFVMASIEKENPTKTYGEIFSMTAETARKKLGLGGVKPPQRGQQSQPSEKKPAFAGNKKGNSRPSAAKEIFDPNAADMF